MAKPRAYIRRTPVGDYWMVYGPRKGATGIIHGYGWTLEEAYEAWSTNYVNVQLY